MQANSPTSLKAFLLAFMAVNFRDSVSVFTRIFDMSRELLSIYCKNYFGAAALFASVTASVCGRWDMLFIFIQGNCLTSITQGLLASKNNAKPRSQAPEARGLIYKYKILEYITLIWMWNKIPLEVITINLDVNIYLFDVPKTIFATVVLP